jgi:hypothetical protein
LDFARLEAQLTTAAKEMAEKQRKITNDELLSPLSSVGSSSPIEGYPPAPTTRPLRSNLATRLQSGMNLQLCFMNDVSEVGDDSCLQCSSDKSSDDSDCGLRVPKSKSTPELRNRGLTVCSVASSGSVGTGSVVFRKAKAVIGRSVSSCSGDSGKRASDLRKSIQEKLAQVEEEDPEARQSRLVTEAKLMLAKAKEAAHMQMEIERLGSAASAKSPVENVVGFPLGRKHLTRQTLCHMNVTQLQIIANEFHTRIEALNEELVHLLVERDSLHMEQDSMLVDIEDLSQHQNCSELKLPEFLIATPVPENKKRFKIFKR